jgi:hypothetical protein
LESDKIEHLAQVAHFDPLDFRNRFATATS